MPRWTLEARNKQSQRCRKNQPWLNSTGAKTEEGKKISARNSYKHGLYDRELLMAKKVLTGHQRELTKLNRELNLRVNLT
jgi:hypothetical protein